MIEEMNEHSKGKLGQEVRKEIRNAQEHIENLKGLLLLLADEESNSMDVIMEVLRIEAQQASQTNGDPQEVSSDFDELLAKATGKRKLDS